MFSIDMVIFTVCFLNDAYHIHTLQKTNCVYLKIYVVIEYMSY